MGSPCARIHTAARNDGTVRQRRSLPSCHAPVSASQRPAATASRPTSHSRLDAPGRLDGTVPLVQLHRCTASMYFRKLIVTTLPYPARIPNADTKLERPRRHMHTHSLSLPLSLSITASQNTNKPHIHDLLYTTSACTLALRAAAYMMNTAPWSRLHYRYGTSDLDWQC